MNTGNKQACKHAVDQPAGNLLASLTVEYMRNIKVVLINKPCMAVSAADAALVTLKRHLENADELAVRGKGEGQHPIFNRTDIVVNNEENIEERIELPSNDNTAKIRDNKRKRSRSSSTSSNSSRSSSGSREGKKRMPQYGKEHNRNVRISPVKWNRRSYNQKEVYKIKQGVLDKNEKNSKALKSRRNRDREQNAKEKCSVACRESCKENSRTSHKIGSSEHYNKNCDRSYYPEKSSCEHKRPRKEKYTRSPSRSPKRYSKSPSNNRQGSPCYRKCSCSPTPDSQRRDQSAHFNQHRQRQKRETARSTRTSSHERSTDNASRSRRDRTRERSSQSPHSRQNTRSSQSRPSSSTKHSETRSKSRSSSSPSKSHNNFHYEGRRDKSPPKHVDQYGAPPYTFGYYGAEGLWIPGPQQRPHFMPRNFIPPPMPMVGGPTYFIPRPYMSAPRPLYRFRPRGIPNRHRMPVSSRATSTVNAVRTSPTRSPSVMEEPSSTCNLNDKDDSP